MLSDQSSASAVRVSALNLLAMREHSLNELKAKLIRKFDAEEVVNSVCERLCEQGLQSDERYTEAFVTMRQRQGKGSHLIALELRQKGVGADLISSNINDFDACWVELAQQQLRKRYGDSRQVDLKERGRRVRFLLSRGFTSDQVRQAFNAD
jgi:regulatory protein